MRMSFMILFFLMCGGGIFYVKYLVQTAESHLTHIDARIDKTQQSIMVLEAEWAMLNDPDRLRHMAQSYLKMSPPRGSQVVAEDVLPYLAKTSTDKELSQLYKLVSFN